MDLDVKTEEMMLPFLIYFRQRLILPHDETIAKLGRSAFSPFREKRLVFDLPNSRGVRRVSKQAFFFENSEKSDFDQFRNGLILMRHLWNTVEFLIMKGLISL